MKSLTDCYELLNGVKIPCVGFGTWQIDDEKIAIQSVSDAIKVGYRHIDTAAAYNNEKGVGIAVKDSGVDRKDIFITSKLQNSMHGYDNTIKAFEQTMINLGTDYLDLYLIHWPNPLQYRDNWEAVNAGTWKAFEELYSQGRIRAIGVSNFRKHHLEALDKTAEFAPMVNQIRICPGDEPIELIDYCKERGIVLEAYSPLGAGKIFSVAEMQKIAEKYGKSIAQICVKFSLQRGYLPLPKSTTFSRIKENAEVFDFTISNEDIDVIASLDGCCGYSRDPDTAEF